MDFREEARKRIIFPLDVSNIDDALLLVGGLYDHVGAFKVGFEFITGTYVNELMLSEKSAIAHLIKRRRLFAAIRGSEFWDGKFNDIKNTVGATSAILGAYGVWAFNVHASAGQEAIKVAVAKRGKSKVFGVTVLTSLKDECESIFGAEPSDKVIRFAFSLLETGADGIICSPEEAPVLRSFHQLDHMLLVTPGVRPTWASSDDQKRVMTPREAVLAGVDYMVIGRPIRIPPPGINSAEVAKYIVDEIAEALSEKGDLACPKN